MSSVSARPRAAGYVVGFLYPGCREQRIRVVTSAGRKICTDSRLRAIIHHADVRGAVADAKEYGNCDLALHAEWAEHAVCAVLDEGADHVIVFEAARNGDAVSVQRTLVEARVLKPIIDRVVRREWALGDRERQDAPPLPADTSAA